MRSALYEGVLVHHRIGPIDHRFRYRLAMPLVYLDEMQELCRLHPLWSYERPNVVMYRRDDYLGGAPSLDGAVRNLVFERLGRRPSGPIAMLAHPRTWGWLFNPITLYYCFDRTGRGVEALVAEVTNTPWHERHAYVVGEPGTHQLDKALHVSPFFGMDLRYEIDYRSPDAVLLLRISCVGPDGRSSFDAVLRLERREATRRELGRLLVAHPLMTMHVSAAIYRQAFRLWRGGASFVAHPRRARGVSQRSLTTHSVPAEAVSDNGTAREVEHVRGGP